MDDDRLFTAMETGTLNMHTLTRSRLPTAQTAHSHLEISKLVTQMGHREKANAIRTCNLIHKYNRDLHKLTMNPLQLKTAGSVSETHRGITH